MKLSEVPEADREAVRRPMFIDAVMQGTMKLSEVPEADQRWVKIQVTKEMKKILARASEKVDEVLREHFDKQVHEITREY